MNNEEWTDYFSYASYLPVREAAANLKNGLAELGLTPSPNTGHVRAVRFHDEYRRYLFSFIINQASLLFYVRLPALKASSVLALQAAERFPSAKSNPAGETTILLSSMADAEAVVAWLSGALPLPYVR